MTMTAKEMIGYHIRKLRSARRPPLSINKLAILAEVDSGQLSRAERGLSGLSFDALQRIANILNISLGDLLDANNTIEKHTVTEPSSHYKVDECTQLVGKLTDAVWQQFHQKKVACSKAEKSLIQHQIRAAIEEGIQRGQVLAEREIESIRKNKET